MIAFRRHALPLGFVAAILLISLTAVPQAADPAIADALSPTAILPEIASKPPSPNGRGNPLWDVSVAALTATQERPIFSPSRRRQEVVPLPQIQPPPPVVENLQKPGLMLVGAIASEANSIAIFLDETTKGVVRLKIGESYSGWTLQQVKGREATLQNDSETAILALAKPPAQ
jgi:general secretion pathway protein N